MNKVEEALHDDLDTFDKFVTNPENVEKYKQGLIEENELTISRAKMYTEALWDLHEVLMIGAKDYLKEFKLDNKLNLEYLEEATDFSFSRKFRF